MKDATDYLEALRSLIIANPHVARWAILREETQGELGLFRYRLTLQDGALLEMVARFRVVAGQVQVGTYAFHWQDARGALIKLWDNAAHHPEVVTHPHHLHDGQTGRVLPHAPISTEAVLALVTEA